MKAVLINPFGMSYYGKVRYPSIFPLGLGQLLAASKTRGLGVTILDCDIDDIGPESPEFMRRLVTLNPDVVGVSYWSFNRETILKTLTTVKRALGKVITVVGGPEPTVRGEECVKHPVIDFAFRGESEVGFPMFLEALSDNRNTFQDIPGLVYREGEDTISNDQVFPEDLDSFGHVDYETLQLRKYHRRGYQYGPSRQLSAPIQATRGCPYQCQFCSASRINGTRVCSVSVSHLMTDIHRLYRDFGVRTINFVDDNFTVRRDYVIDVCRAIEESHLEGLTMGSPNGIHLETIDPELVGIMRRAGWTNFMVSPESGSEETLMRMKKRIDLPAVPEKVRMIKETGIFVTGCFIVGYPGETRDDIRMTSEFIGRCDFDMISINKFQPLPGTPIFEELVNRGEIDSDFMPVDTIGPSVYSPEGMTCAELDRLHRKIYQDFFVRSPMKALRALRNVGISRIYKRAQWLFSSR